MSPGPHVARQVRCDPSLPLGSNVMQPSHLDVRESADSALLTYLQASVEIDKASLAKELHDNLGGLIVAAVMDIAWAEEHSSSLASADRGRLRRVREALRSALDINRRIIEELRPSLLDNVGLFAALSWELKPALLWALSARRDAFHARGLNCVVPNRAGSTGDFQHAFVGYRGRTLGINRPRDDNTAIRQRRNGVSAR
jgi:Histidine kinase